MTVVYLEKRDAARNMQRHYRVTVAPTLFGEWAMVRERSCANATTCRCCLISTNRPAAILPKPSRCSPVWRSSLSRISRKRGVSPKNSWSLRPTSHPSRSSRCCRKERGNTACSSTSGDTWVLKEHVYASPQQLIADLAAQVIGPAEAKVRELRQ